MAYLVALLLLLAGARAQPGPLLREFLTDANFEHTTQAATGQTTGVWLVSFCSSTALPCTAMDATWEGLRQELREQQIFLAKVDVHRSPMLRGRFSVQQLPTILLFRDRKMYKFPHGPVQLEELRQFALARYSESPALDVPLQPSAFDWLAKLAHEKVEVVRHALEHGDHRTLAIALLPGVLMALVIAGFSVAAVRYKEKKD